MIIDRKRYNCYYIDNHPWYPYLVSSVRYNPDGTSYRTTGLLDRYGSHLTENSFIVCYTPGVVKEPRVRERITQGGEELSLRTIIQTYWVDRIYRDDDGSARRLYAHFPSIWEFYQYYYRCPRRYFHEVIRGNEPQKARFDIDIDSHPDIDHVTDCTLGLLFDTIEEIFAGYHLPFTVEDDLLVYESNHYPDGSLAPKRSYHIVFRRWCHLNNEEAHAFYDVVLAKMGDGFRRYIDPAIYSRTQCFRLVGSSKYEEDVAHHRYKRRLSTLTIGTRTYHWPSPSVTGGYDCEEFRQSLITDVHACSFLPRFRTDSCLKCQEAIRAVQSNSSLPPLQRWTLLSEDIKCEECTARINREYPEINYSQANDYLRIVETTLSLPNYFRVRSLGPGRIDLLRLRPYYCPTCHRTHEHENPYLLIRETSLLFYCRRTDHGYSVPLVPSPSSSDPLPPPSPISPPSSAPPCPSPSLPDPPCPSLSLPDPQKETSHLPLVRSAASFVPPPLVRSPVLSAPPPLVRSAPSFAPLPLMKGTDRRNNITLKPRKIVHTFL